MPPLYGLHLLQGWYPCATILSLLSVESFRFAVGRELHEVLWNFLVFVFKTYVVPDASAFAVSCCDSFTDGASQTEPLPFGSPAFHVSDAGTLNVTFFPSDTATIVPSSSVLYTLTPFIRNVLSVSACGWP